MRDITPTFCFSFHSWVDLSFCCQGLDSSVIHWFRIYQQRTCYHRRSETWDVTKSAEVFDSTKIDLEISTKRCYLRIKECRSSIRVWNSRVWYQQSTTSRLDRNLPRERAFPKLRSGPPRHGGKEKQRTGPSWKVLFPSPAVVLIVSFCFFVFFWLTFRTVAMTQIFQELRL